MPYLSGFSLYSVRMAFITVTWICVLLTVMTSSLAQNSVTGMRIGAVQIDESPGLRLVVETRSPMQARLSLLTDPYRLVIDMPDASWQVDGLSQRGDLGTELARVYRFGSPKPDTGRLVIELDQPAAPVRVFTLPPASGGERFVVDLVNVGDTAFMVAAAALKKSPDTIFLALPSDLTTANSPTKPVGKKMKLPKSKGSMQAISKWEEDIEFIDNILKKEL